MSAVSPLSGDHHLTLSRPSPPDKMLERVSRLLEHILADKCHCCGESIDTAHKVGPRTTLLAGSRLYWRG